MRKERAVAFGATSHCARLPRLQSAPVRNPRHNGAPMVTGPSRWAYMRGATTVAVPVGVACAALFCLTASSARADHARTEQTKAACADAYGKAQVLRDAHKLVSAREQLRVCARTSCTRFIARDCATWLGEVEARIPSVVLSAQEATGADIVDATVTMDGAVIAERLDGRAI